MSDGSPVIGQSKKKEKKPPPLHLSLGAPEWLTTFADMMSLLLTFFILLYSISAVETKKVFEMHKSFEKYFNLDIEPMGYSSQQVELKELPDALADLGTPDSPKPADQGRSLEKQDAEIIDRYASVSRTASHNVIIIQGSVLFAPGSARIAEEAKPSLLKIAARLQRYANRIKIIGHTSPLPLDPAAGFADHDELGYRRAKAVGRFLSGAEGDLAKLARSLLPQKAADRVTSGIFSVDPARFVYATRGYHSPVATGKLWEDLEKNDRVEMVFLPEMVEGLERH
jgi:chemotaxis protein MotB